jgi:hypothetical protein
MLSTTIEGKIVIFERKFKFRLIFRRPQRKMNKLAMITITKIYTLRITTNLNRKGCVQAIATVNHTIKLAAVIQTLNKNFFDS